MSVFRSLYIGSSAVNAHGGAISVVGDNIANVSTTGYRSSRALFADMLGGQLGDNRLGSGVSLGGIQTIHQQGALQQTGAPLDMAVMGSGFLVFARGADPAGNAFSRDGRLALDSSGYIVNSANMKLQGYAIDAAGQRSSQLSGIQLGSTGSPPRATTAADVALNLDPNAPILAAPFDPLDPSATSNFSTSMTVFDSLGSAHRVDMYFRRAGAGSWEWHGMVDGGELNAGTAGQPTQIADGTLTFNTDGALDTETVNSSSADFLNATAAQAITFDFGNDIAGGGTGLLGTTQFSGASTVSSVNQDGFAQGTLVDTKIKEDGTVMGVFSNGQSRAMAQVALATFGSEDGLAREGNSMFSETSESGQPLIEPAGTGGRGAIVGGALEASTVDLSGELVTLIAYQRAMQANVRTISTADEMLAEIANLKR